MTDDEYTLHASAWLQPVIEQLLERPVAAQRWRALRNPIDRALSERAAGSGVSKQQTLRSMARAAILLTLNELKVPARLFDPDEPMAPRAQKYVLEHVRSRVNNLVTEDLLGPGWRHPVGSQDDSEPVAEYSLQDELEIESELRWVLDELQDDEQDLILGQYLGESWAEIGERLDKSESSLWMRWARLKKRLISKLQK